MHSLNEPDQLVGKVGMRAGMGSGCVVVVVVFFVCFFFFFVCFFFVVFFFFFFVSFLFFLWFMASYQQLLGIFMTLMLKT